MGMMSRRKGAAGEREAAEKLNEILGTKFHRGRQYHGGVDSPDLAGDCPNLHLEVKRVEALALYPALEQARRDAGTHQVPAVMHRRNGKPWVLAVYADDLIRLLDVVDECRERSDVTTDATGCASPAPAPLLTGGPTPGEEQAGEPRLCGDCRRSCLFAGNSAALACPRFQAEPAAYPVGGEG